MGKIIVVEGSDTNPFLKRIEEDLVFVKLGCGLDMRFPGEFNGVDMFHHGTLLAAVIHEDGARIVVSTASAPCLDHVSVSQAKDLLKDTAAEAVVFGTATGLSPESGMVTILKVDEDGIVPLLQVPGMEPEHFRRLLIYEARKLERGLPPIKLAA